MATTSPEPVRFDADTTLFETRITLGDRPCPLSIVDMEEHDTEQATKLAQKTGAWLETRGNKPGWDTCACNPLGIAEYLQRRLAGPANLPRSGSR